MIRFIYRLGLLTALFLIPDATAASAPLNQAQKFMGTNSLPFVGEGNTLGTGETVSVSGPLSVGFNTINKDVYIGSFNGHSIRKVEPSDDHDAAWKHHGVGFRAC